mmetsp:Transcript_13595/g.47379  ORF Transcript_13595/g.47379 Transcript_13595/m.47379 type:complete len:436 (-) Transcript_13595:2893-4200(-)
MPPPHDSVHALHSDHADATHARGSPPSSHSDESPGHETAPPTRVTASKQTPRSVEQLPVVSPKHAAHWPGVSATHATALHACSCASARPHVASAPSPATTNFRARERRPPPHVALHAPHAPHGPTTHVLPGQASSPQVSTSESGGQAAPRRFALVTTSRLRVRLPPPPHGTEHSPQALHSPTTQSTGHVAASVCVSAGQTAPLPAAASTTVRVRVRTPAAHAPHAPHSDTRHGVSADVQATAAEHVCVSERAGHAAPPATAPDSTVRVRVRSGNAAPSAHVHKPHGPQPDTWQSAGTGQARTRQLRSSKRAAHAPPPVAGLTSTRERLWRPGPHVAEQGVHADHGVSMHGTGGPEPSSPVQSPAQETVSTWAGHAAPLPAAAVTTARERVAVPAPHDELHSEASDHSDMTQSTSSTSSAHVSPAKPGRHLHVNAA